MELILREIQASCEADVYQPLVSWLTAQKNGKSHPPYIPQWDPMPLHNLCALALLWHEAGFVNEAGQLAHFLLPLEPFPSLWCPEKEFNEQKILQLFSHLKKIVPIPLQIPDFGLTLWQAPSISVALTLTGNGTSMGVIRTQDTEIRAFGPQALPLTDQNRFGIKGRGLDGWTSCFALPEVWLKLESHFERAAQRNPIPSGLKSSKLLTIREKELFAPLRSGESPSLQEGVLPSDCKLDLRFVGNTPEEPLAFVFYAKSQSCRIGNEIFQSKSLRRFQGQGQTVHLGKTIIQSSSPHKIQVIPLAGIGCFWDTDFLISFEMHSLNLQTVFTIGQVI